MSLVDIRIPDIGDFKDVEVIEILVKVGDKITKEQSLITVESDKASMEIPSPEGGEIKNISVKLGDKVNQGDVIMQVEVATAAAAASPQQQQQPAQNEAVAAAGQAGAEAESDIQADVVVLGGGPGGYSAAFRAADLGLKVVLVERYATLGGVCLNVGCIPSKALLHVTAVMHEVGSLEQAGIKYAAPSVDLSALRAHKSKVVGKLTGGLAAMAKMRQVKVIRGIGTFTGAHSLKVQLTQGKGQELNGQSTVVGFKYAIIAAGSQAVKLPFLPDDERIIDSTGALALAKVPPRMLIIGGGIIGLEMATVYSSLGAEIDIVEAADSLMAGADKDLVKIWQKYNSGRFANIMLNTKTVGAIATEKGIEVSFDGADAPQPQLYDLVLEAVGRRPNGKLIGAENLGIAVDEKGFITVDRQQRTSVAHIYAIGDIVGQPMLAHKAVHEAHVAAEVIVGQLLNDAKLATTSFDARVIPSVAYTDPEVAWVGITEAAAKEQGIAVTKAVFPWSASGRAIANGRE